MSELKDSKAQHGISACWSSELCAKMRHGISLNNFFVTVSRQFYLVWVWLPDLHITVRSCCPISE